ncbi:MAG: SurA N-terminal domain-containing protein [Hydrogenophilus sp.]|nr:SurA N-terminal domain-containing protein [Hydrogenophilus sp.]
MLDAIRRRKRFAQVVLLVLILPFAFFGIEHYFAGGPSQSEVARVGERPVPVAALREALEREANRRRAEQKEQFKPEEVRRPDFVREVLRGLVERELLLAEAERLGLRVSPEEVRATIAAAPVFQREGRFDYATYEGVLRSQGWTPARFEEAVAADLVAERLYQAVQSGIARIQEAQAWVAWSEQERRVRWRRWSIAVTAETVAVDERAVRAFFEAHRDRYRLPERVALAYFVLKPEQVPVEIKEEEVIARYEEQRHNFAFPERRRVRVVVVRSEEQARALIAAVVGREEQTFAEIAATYAEDPAGQRTGGDLGWVVRDDLPTPLAEAIFAAAVPAVVGPVPLPNGVAVAFVGEVARAEVPPLSAVRGQIVAELTAEAQQRRFAEMVTELPDRLYEAVDRLEEVAERYGAVVQRSELLPLEEVQVEGGPLPQQLVAAIRSEAGRRGENLEPVTLPDGRVVAARAVHYEPARERPFEEVAERVVRDWQRQEARRRLSAAANRGHEEEGAWNDEASVRRTDPRLPPEVREAIFAPEMREGERRVVELEEEVWLVELVGRQLPTVVADDERVVSIRPWLARWVGEVEYRAWIETLKARFPVRVREEALKAFTGEE